MQYAQIILPLNLKGTFTYKVPEEIQSTIQLGMRVLVPFGGKKIYTGIVFELHDEEPTQFVAKEVISILDEQPILPLEQIKFWKWLSDYYLCNLGEIYRFSFPSSLKLESETYLKLKPNITVEFENLDVNEMYLIQALEVRQLINLTDIEAFIPKKDIIKTINSLIDLQYIEIDEKIAEKYKAKEVAYVKINDEVLKNNNLTEILLSLKRAQKQKDLFLHILEKQTENPDLHIKKSELFEDGYFSSSHFKSLADKNLVEEYYMQKDRIESYEGEIEEVEELTEVQKAAKIEVDEAFEEGRNVLLHGVTSSGKTHIYLEKIEECISEGKNVLFLLPEISLTKQITQRLEKKYGKQLGFYHQKLTDFEKVEIWRRTKNNNIKILIATRNALFLPYQNLGLIVVDEEHDSGYKPREVSPFFNAKDSALVLANFYGANVILGSATPSVESYYLARKEKMKYIFLNERFGNVKLPEFELINFKEAQDSKKVSGNFSLKLIDEIKKTLEEKNQTMILHNRRGYASVLECESCGYVNYCSNCDVVMTYHKAAHEMKCHYCGQRASKPKTCPKCYSENLNEKGVGVEQIHEEISKIFPDNEVDRMDVDSMRKKFAYEKLYEKIEDRETDIVVGTQMISKGLDFDHIELVAIPKADSMLYVQDFRAEERAYQLITQVSGRAGRVSGKGRVLIQTFNPDHSVFQLIKMNNISKIYKYFLTERQKFNYPPFTKLIMIELKHRRDEKVDRASQFLGSVLRKYLPEDCILGPERAQIARLNNLYQFQVLLKLPRGKNYEKFKSLVLLSLKEFDEITAYQSIKKDVFVDF
ncbi:MULTISPECIES: primosomal protein N' [Chryseobacterium]|uniref:replication restart helicase PriA n=2 Tax=Chryseobacterium group TaxID=2782232 RepID=UPI00195D7501|nr:MULTISPECIES: primosomal protein N' [Chryseobacterium]MBM7420939.1 primosomal protein N' (replication factor Y) [Chryseobacterium sp. JUb44]MDH6210896.1 primosomal protein N' (replication factor Y) [Chryseobacterium sp. BIGb0186]WSO09566.1 primosomal protein N' [Chryseobacterium scophthalmum]